MKIVWILFLLGVALFLVGIGAATQKAAGAERSCTATKGEGTCKPPKRPKCTGKYCI